MTEAREIVKDYVKTLNKFTVLCDNKSDLSDCGSEVYKDNEKFLTKTCWTETVTKVWGYHNQFIASFGKGMGPFRMFPSLFVRMSLSESNPLYFDPNGRDKETLDWVIATIESALTQDWTSERRDLWRSELEERK